MNAEQWQRVKDVFVEAYLLDPEAREEFLAAACADDGVVKAEVVSLLAAQEHAGDFERLAPPFMRPLISETHAIGDSKPRCGRYEVGDEIGRGGMGVVYRAYDPHLRRDVALKLLSPELADDEWSVRLLAEARAASALDHPNVCTIFDIGRSEDGRPYLAMAYYEGETLKDRLRAGSLPPEEAMEIAIQIAEGLDHAHSAGIVHRDVKPANILLTDSGTVKMLDFGIARYEDGAGLTRTGVRPGTPAYMAPEQVRGEKVDGRADVWALGVVLHEMLSGRRPFHAPTEFGLLQAILEEEPPPPSSFQSSIPPALDDVVLLSLRKDPSQRMKSAAAFAASLKSVRPGDRNISSSTANAPPTAGLDHRLIGRERELVELRDLLRRNRLLTLTGPGGIGKTSLALELAERCRREFPGDVCFVDLSLIAEPSQIAREIADCLGLIEHPSNPVIEVIEAHLSNRVSLLILDNFEQVVSGASVVSELLASCSGLKILATSRIPLSLTLEQEYPVPPLGLPLRETRLSEHVEEEWPALRLFVDRARRVRPDFAITSGNRDSVAELCRQLDGLPLAIELAAARVKMFPPAALLERISDRLDLLGGHFMDRPERHQTLEAAIGWSFDLLEPRLKRVFEQLSVFSGGFTIEAAETVVRVEDGQSVIEGLVALHEHSLLQRAGTDEHPRFSLLVTIRTFAQIQAVRSGTRAPAARRHAEYFAGAAERIGAALTGPDQETALDQLEADQDNLRAAILYSIESGEADLGLRMVGVLWRYWIVRGHLSAGREYLERVLQIPSPGMETLRARALHGVATIAHNQGDNQDAKRYLEESLALWRKTGDQSGLAAALNNLAWVACEMSDLGNAETLSLEALELCARLGDPSGKALALNNLGWIAMYRGLPLESLRNHAESLRLRRHLGDRRGAAFALAGVAHAEQMHGDTARAQKHITDALNVFEALRDRGLSAYANTIWGQVAAYEGEYAESTEIFEHAASLWRAEGNRAGLAWSLTELGGVVLSRGEIERSRQLLEEAIDLWRAVETPWGVAFAQYRLADAAWAEQDWTTALDLYNASLDTLSALGDVRGQAECLEGIARLEAVHGDRKIALERLEAAQRLRAQAEVPVAPRKREDLHRLAAELRSGAAS